MAHYAYSAYARDGSLAAGTIEAASEEEAYRLLQAQAIMPFALEAAAPNAPAHGAGGLFPSGRRKGPSAAELVAFFSGLDTLLDASLGIEGALALIAKETRRSRMREIILDLHEKVTAGTALSEAMMEHDGVFGPHVVASVEAGEISGSLPAMIGDLSAALERELALRRKIVSALVYPAFLIVAALCVFGIIMVALIPAVRPLFETAAVAPPWILDLLLKAGDAMVAPVFWAATGLLGMSVLWTLRSPRLKAVREALLLSVPVVGGFLRDADLARFAAISSMLLRGGASLDRAFAAAAGTLRAARLRRQAERALEAVTGGMSVVDALRDTALIDGQSLQILKVAEESGGLEKGFARLARLAEARMERQSERFLKALTPILTLGVGGMIGLIITAIMDAVLQLNEIAFQ